MLNFKAETLDPTVAPILKKLGAVLKMGNVTEKTEQMLALKERLNRVVDKMSEMEGSKGLFMGVGLMLAAAEGLTSAGVSSEAAGLLGSLLGGSVSLKHFLNLDAVSKKRMIAAQIDKEVGRLAIAHPRAVMKSLRYQRSIRNAFSSAHKSGAMLHSAAQKGRRFSPK